MLFASDLDQTLIYSRKSFGISPADMPVVRLIETLDGKEISFITEEAIQLVKEVSKRALFVPVTTRTIEQYERISLFQNEVQPKYAVTTNGGNILIHGIPDSDWNKLIHNKVKHDCLAMDDVLRRFNEIKSDKWLLKEKVAESLFYYCVVDREQLPLDEIMGFTAWAKENDWSVSLQGRKVYLVPRVVNKRDALAHISLLEGKTTIFAAGDSLLDLPMLEYAHHAFAPSHGEIHRLYTAEANNPHGITFTDTSGITASHEILNNILYYITRNDSKDKRSLV